MLIRASRLVSEVWFGTSVPFSQIKGSYLLVHFARYSSRSQENSSNSRTQAIQPNGNLCISCVLMGRQSNSVDSQETDSEENSPEQCSAIVIQPPRDWLTAQHRVVGWRYRYLPWGITHYSPVEQ